MVKECMQQKVLVIEDSPTSMKVLAHLITSSNLEPVCANSLTQAQHIFNQSTPEDYLCAVVDYNLPDAPEGEAIDFAIASFIPTVVITGRLDEVTREKVLSKDVVDYIPKENAQVYDYLARLLLRLEKNKSIGVLVVDDSRLTRSMIATLLRRHNFVTYEASDGNEGITELRQNPNIKLVITDENMPNMTGIEMVAEIRRTISKEDLAIIGLSGQGSTALSARFIKSGANDYLSKPYCHEEFFCRIIQNIEYIENIEAIRRAANTDYLTGLPNRRHFFTRVNANLKMSPKQVSVGIIDLDLFKGINDSFGHDAGDAALKEVAGFINKHFGDYHTSRFGGEEFCVFISGEDPQIALDMFESFRKDVEQHSMHFEEQEISFTVSIGMTAKFEGNVEDMIRLADENLYKAKGNGRNQTVAS